MCLQSQCLSKNANLETAPPKEKQKSTKAECCYSDYFICWVYSKAGDANPVYHPRGLSCTLSLAQHHHSSCQIPPAVPEPKLVYVPTGNQMPLNVRSLELPGWGEQFVPIRAALRKCPICNADTSSHVGNGHRTSLSPPPDTKPVPPARGDRQPRAPPVPEEYLRAALSSLCICFTGS